MTQMEFDVTRRGSLIFTVLDVHLCASRSFDFLVADTKYSICIDMDDLCDGNQMGRLGSEPHVILPDEHNCERAILDVLLRGIFRQQLTQPSQNQ